MNGEFRQSRGNPLSKIGQHGALRAGGRMAKIQDKSRVLKWSHFHAAI
jgi:hypothetical protein